MPFSLARRAMLTLFGGGAMVAASTAQREGARNSGAADTSTAQPIADTPPATGIRTIYGHNRQAGTWRWTEGDFAERVAADPLGGLTVRHATTPPGRGAWVREWDGTVGRAEWFGARADDADFDNVPAIQAALDLCPTVQLGAGIYHVRAGLRIERSGTRLLGAGITQTDQGENRGATEIVCSNPSATILQIGSDSQRQPGRLVETVQLQDFTVRRSVAPFIPSEGFAGAIGIALRWCVNCHIDRVFSIDSARGWHFYGTIENYVRHCSALRGIAGTLAAKDFFIGFHLDYDAPLGTNGGNASLYFDHVRAFGGYGRGTPRMAYSAGLRTDGGWVDLFINALETGAVDYGIHGVGDGGSALSFRTEDLIVSNCVLDMSRLAGIQLESAGPNCAVQIANCYCAVAPSGTAIVLFNLGGSVSLTGNQYIMGEHGGTALSAVAVSNLRSTGNICTRFRQAIYLERVSGFHIADTIQAVFTANDYPAIGLVDCTRGKIDTIITARPGAVTAGIEFKRTASRRVEVNLTAIDVGGAPALIEMGKRVAQPGPFGAGNTATGLPG